ncbi:MAG: AMP-binding protein, partial [Candidatus Omnitrophota bacterium]|nr:AMP-binding protein [Candidatus Omnitrophota bacterium]
MDQPLFTLGKKFSEVCRRNSSRTVLKVHTFGPDYSTYTYQQLLDGANKVAAWLISQNVKKQDRVAVILENSFEWIVIYFGIMLSGAVAVPLDPQMARETIFMLLRDSESKIVFVSRKLKNHFNIISDTLIGLKKIVLVSSPKDESEAFVFEYRFSSFSDLMAQGFPGDISFPAIELDEAASILYTSGTTAVAKGVQLSHRNFSANFLSIAKLNFCSSEDNLICLLPLFHAYSFMATLIFPLFLGARVTLPASLKSEGLLECMRTCGVTILIGVPELFYNLHKGISEKINKLPTVKRFLLRRALNGTSYLREVFKINLSRVILKEVHNRFGDKLRYLISGGARLEPKVAQDLQDLGFTVLEGYGLTETSPIVTFNPINKPKIGSVGKPVSAVEVRIVNPDKDGVGEVAIRGQNVMKGYYRLPEETRKVLKGGWFYSGDLGYLDNEGYLFLTGRSKEVIVLSSGKNIYPEEIEEYYCQSSFIKEICVEGIVQGSSVVLKAIIVPDFDYLKLNALTDIQGKIKWDLENYSKELPGYKRILGFVIVKDPLPRTRLGKIKRYEVREKYRNELLGEKSEHREYALSAQDERIMNSEIGSKVIDYLSKELPKQKVNLSDHLELDLSIDSLAKVDLIVGMEEIFKVALPDNFLTKISTVKELIENVENAIYG